MKGGIFMEKRDFNKLEELDCELFKLKNLIGLMYDECCTSIPMKLGGYEAKQKLEIATTLTTAIFDLILNQSEKLSEYIRKSCN